MVNRFFGTDRPNLQRVIDWATDRIDGVPSRTASARSATELEAAMSGSVSPSGIGAEAALVLFDEVIVPATRAQADEMNVAYVPTAATSAAVTFDLAVSAAEIFAGTWETGAGAIHAENQALRWLADLAGYPADAGGTFVPGGTVGNLSALHAARVSAEWRRERPSRWRLAVSPEVHSSVRNAASILDVDICEVAVGPDGRMRGVDLDRAIGDSLDVFAVVATAGTTNAGVVDDLASVAKYCGDNDLWLHVDGAYGLAAMASPRVRPIFDGIDRADSFVVDPHKWLFAPYDACALLYRRPADGAEAHSQVAPYLDQLDRGEWNPCDYAIQLSRRPRGLPFWFSLATYGTGRYAEAIDRVIATTRDVAEMIESSDFAELVALSELSVLLFRVPGLSDEQVRSWSDTQALAGTVLCLPTTHRGEQVLRICLVNPDTDASELFSALETLRGFAR